MLPVSARSAATLLSVLLATARPALALDCIDYSELPHQLGRAWDVTSIGDVALSGDFAFVLGESSPSGLWVVDVSNPEQPDQVGFVALPGTPRAVEVQGNHAYVACDDAGLQIVDVSLPASPAIVAATPTLDRTWDLAVADDVVWIADFNAGYAGIDVTDPSAPVEIVRDGSEAIDRIAAAGMTLLTVHNGDPDIVLRTRDVSDPASPVDLGVDDVLGCVWPFWCDTIDDLELVGNRAYVLMNVANCVDQYNCWEYDYWYSFQVWDLSDLSNPFRFRSVVLESARNVSLSGTALAVHGTRAYVSASTRKFHVIDLTDPDDPQWIHSVPTGIGGRGIAARSDAGTELAFVADQGLTVWDVTNADLPTAVGGNGVDQSMHDVAMIGDVAYTVGSTLDQWPGWISIRGWDLTDPANPSQLFSSSSTGYGFFADLEAANGDLYRSGHSAAGYLLSRSEIQPDGSPGPLTPLFGPAVDTEPIDPYLLMASGPSGLAVLETFPDADPVLVAQEGPSAHRVAADGELAVVLQGGTWSSSGVIHTIDLQDPTAPAFVADLSLASPSFRWIAMRKRLVAVGGAGAAAPEDLRLVDVSDPAAPELLASLDLPGDSVDGAFVGSTLYVLLGSGCVAVDVRNPSFPVVIGQVSADPGVALLASGEHVLLCEGNRLTGIPGHCVADVGAVGVTPIVVPFAGLRAVPNPFRRTTMIRYEGRARVDLYDSSGRHVRRLAGETQGGAVVWDGTDTGGRRVAPGVYFLRLQSGERSATAKVTYLR